MRTTMLLVLCIALSACSRKSPEELYNEATRAISRSEFRLAADRFEEILSQDQHSTVAESALYRVALLYNNELHDIGKAVSYYEQYTTTYPSSSHAPTALFLAAFLLNNDLHSTDSAKAQYQKFLQLYPNHELAPSAKFELENLGRDPSELTPAPVASETPPPAKGKKSHTMK